jgi:predicted ATPase
MTHPTVSAAERDHLHSDLLAEQLNIARLRAALAGGDDPMADFKPPADADAALINTQRHLLLNQVVEHRAKIAALADQAVAEVTRTGERWWEAEAQRSRGEILLMASPLRLQEAERCFIKALACARRQGARLWELHAAQSLASLWLMQGRNDDARELLAQVYATFSDGFDTANLKLAKATLDQLARPAKRAPGLGGAVAIKRGR